MYIWVQTLRWHRFESLCLNGKGNYHCKIQKWIKYCHSTYCTWFVIGLLCQCCTHTRRDTLSSRTPVAKATAAYKLLSTSWRIKCNCLDLIYCLMIKVRTAGVFFKVQTNSEEKNRLKQTRNWLHPVKYNHLKVRTILLSWKNQEKKLCLTLLMLFHTCAYDTRFP